MVKLIAKQVRETKDAYLLRFSFTNEDFDLSNLKDIYYPYLKEFNWNIWVPRKKCKSLRYNKYYIIEQDIFDILESTIQVDIEKINKKKPFKFSKFKFLFTSFDLPKELVGVYSSYLQQSLMN
jgi:hypothetical protein